MEVGISGLYGASVRSHVEVAPMNDTDHALIQHHNTVALTVPDKMLCQKRVTQITAQVSNIKTYLICLLYAWRFLKGNQKL